MKQVRFIPVNTCGLQVRAGEDGQQSRTVVGTPIVFGVRSNNLTPYSSYREVYEVMEPGCISDELLRESDIVLNLNHSNKVTDILGRCKDGEGNLKLTKNLRDIGCECEVVNTTTANDALELVRAKIITGMSFAFEDDWEDSENGVSYERMKNEDHDGKEVWVRHVKRVTALYDVSIVTHPAYEQTAVATRESSDLIDAAIEAQLKREQPQETEEEKQAREAKEREANGGETNTEKAEREAREAKEREANGGETNTEKAEREAREAKEREANGGETNAEKQARETEELERKAREAKAVMRMRLNLLDLETEEIDF